MKKLNFRHLLAGILAFSVGFATLAMPYRSSAQEVPQRSVTVRYLEAGNEGNVIQPDKVILAQTDSVDEEYDASTPEYAPEVLGKESKEYRLLSNVPTEGDGAEKGTFTAAHTEPRRGTVTYLYKAIGKPVTAVGMSRDGVELFRTTVAEGALEGTRYSFEVPQAYAKDNVNYNFVEKGEGSADVEGEVTDVEKEIRLVYKANNTPTSGEYTVKSIIEGTTTELGSKTRSQYPFGEALVIEQDQYAGYTFVRTEGDTSPLSEENPTREILNIYRENPSTATIRYVDESTGQELEPQIDKTKDGDEALVVVQKAFPDHKFVRKEGPEGWNIGGHVDITLYYTPKQVFTLTVKHLNKATNEAIADESTQSVKEGTNYSTEPLANSDRIKLDAMPANANGTITENTVVTYLYNLEKEPAYVTVQHLVKGTDNQVRPAESKEAKDGDQVTFSHADVVGYTPASDSVTYTYRAGEPGLVKLFYEKIPSYLVVVHLDSETGAEIYRTFADGTVGDSYSTTAGKFTGYQFVSVEGAPNGNYVAGTTTVKYYYKKVVGSLVVKFLDVDTNIALTEDKVEGNLPVGTQYKAKSATIEGYELVEVPANAEGTIVEGTNTVIFTYRKTSTDVNPDGTVGNDTTNGTPNVIEGSTVDLDKPSIGEVIEKSGVNVTENNPIYGASQESNKTSVPDTSDPVSLYFLLGGLGLAGIAASRKRKQSK